MKTKYFLLILILENFTQNVAALATSCVGDSGYCNPNWTPVNNMIAALQGYNIREGDPTSNFDPGFQGQIFQATKTHSDGRIELESGITVLEHLNCKTTLASASFTNIESYRNALISSIWSAADFQLGVEAEVTNGIELKGAIFKEAKIIPSAFNKAWEDSKTIKDTQNFFLTEKGMISIATGFCLQNQVKIDTDSPPPFFEAFKIALGVLQSASQLPDTEKKKVFQQFTHAFGTHYLTQTKLGTQIAHYTKYSGQVRQEIAASTLQQCNLEKGAKAFGIQIEKGSSSCSESDTESIKQYGTEKVQAGIFAKGSQPENGAKEWLTKNFTSVPISFQLSPIINLFKKDLIDDKSLLFNGQRIIASEIRKWFVPLYFDYCNSMNIDCYEQKSGCGINDSCSVDKICFEKSDKRQQCSSPFTCEKKETQFDDEGGGNVFYLDRHQLTCGENQAISQFKLERNGRGKYRYAYTCCSTQLPCSQVILVQNGFTEARDSFYLDRQNIICLQSYINGFKIDRSGDYLRYAYPCCYVNEDKECYDAQTALSYNGKGDTIYLDRQEVSCKKFHTLTRFKLERQSLDHVFYSYQCCKTTPTFTSNSTQLCKPTYTQYNLEQNGDVYYLDRHHLQCETGYALKSFKLERDVKGNYRYAGVCCTVASSCTRRVSNNPFTIVENSNAIYLDRQHVLCQDQYLTNFVLQRNSKDVRYFYSCCESPKPKSCYESNTAFNDDGGGKAYYLDRHNVACSEGYFLSNFRLVRNSSGNQWKYLIRCCKE